MKLKSIRQVRRLHNRAQYAILKKNFAIILGGDIITSKRSFLVNFVNTVLLFAVVIFIHAVTGTADKGEANMGDFSVESLNEGWTLNNESISLPATIDVSDEKEFTIYNTLPGDIKDGMEHRQLQLRSGREETLENRTERPHTGGNKAERQGNAEEQDDSPAFNAGPCDIHATVSSLSVPRGGNGRH